MMRHFDLEAGPGLQSQISTPGMIPQKPTRETTPQVGGPDAHPMPGAV